jgi:nicotinamidase-related amidase/type 1 glutamine amidotransferase
MWDLHHCLNATRRGAEMAPRMNQFLKEVRSRGVLVIHAPSSCMDAYKDHPARKHAQETPRASKLPKDIGQWCNRIPSEEKGTYPIDQTDGGEDDDLTEHAAWAAKLKGMGRNPRAPWKSQTDALTILDTDYISDSGEEIWSILQQRGINNVILVGVHTNMCVLGRPFGLRQMAKNGKNVVLVRDLTDTMYNPARAPYVSHFTGTDLIVEHVEKWVCPTMTSDQLLGGKPFRFAGDKRPHVVLILAEDEYDTALTLPEFAAKHLGKEFRVSCVFGSDKDRDLPGLDVLNEADLALVSVRRRALPKAQMEMIRKFVDSGKPVLGIRTASHAFSLRGKKPPTGCATWEEFDRDVFGGHYTNHHGTGPKVEVKAAEGVSKHPILAGINLAELKGNGSLYMVSPLAKTATPLLIGSIPEKPAEPIAWVNLPKTGNRVFYTSLGHRDDFKEPAFNRLLVNALRWASGLAAAPTESSFVPMFNGKDLTGWVNVNCAPSTFFVRDNMIVTTGKPTGYLRTAKQYENFIMEFEWMHVPAKEGAVGNSGLFVWCDPLPAVGSGYTRGIEVQVLVNLEYKDKKGRVTATSHGDLFSIWGAKCVPDRPHPSGWSRCLPSENRAKGANEWNHYRVEAKDGVIKLAVNGKVVSGVSQCNPRKGYLALESEGSECRFRNLRIKELPSTNPKPEETANVAEDFKPLYTGLDLSGWVQEPGHKGHWTPRDTVLAYDGKSEAKDKHLWTEKEYGDFVMVCDWRFPAKPKPTKRPVILPSGDYAMEDGKPKEAEVPDAGDSGIYLRGSSKSQVNMWCWPIGSGEVYGYRTDKSMPASVRAGVTPKLKADKPLGQWNRFIITMKGDRLTVNLNGKTVIENAQLPGVAKKGRIALQHHGDPVEFANLFIRELK